MFNENCPLSKKEENKWNVIQMAPHVPIEVLGQNKSLDEDDSYEFADEIIYDDLFPNSTRCLIEEIKKSNASLLEKGVLIKLINLSEAENNFKTWQLEKIKTENIEITRSNAKKYAILSYVWGKRENNAEVLNKAGRKSLVKAIKACKLLDIDYLWIDQLCVDQEEVFKQISELGRYYNSAMITLIAIQAKTNVVKEKTCLADILKLVVNSRWFGRPWTYQEGWLSKRSVFMFDDMLVDGRYLAQFWVLHQPKSFYAEYNRYDFLEEVVKGSVKFATPIGWVYYKNGYNSEDRVFLSLGEAFQEVKRRGKSRLVEGIYSILGVLPYGEKIKVKSKKRGHIYTEEELKEGLTDILLVAKQEGYEKEFEQLLQNEQISNFSQQETVIQQAPYFFVKK